MSYAINNVATKDSYGDPCQILEAHECARVTMIITQAAVIYRLKLPGDLGSQTPWATEHYLPAAVGQPFAFSFDRRCVGIQFKSAVPGTPALVTCQLIPQSELPDNA